MRGPETMPMCSSMAGTNFNAVVTTIRYWTASPAMECSWSGTAGSGRCSQARRGELVIAGRTTECDQTTRRGRLAKAKEFYEAAEMLDVLAHDDTHLVDPYITNCVLAGIAAADVICCARLGVHAIGDNHVEAVALLATVDEGMSKHLDILLRHKSRSSYSALASSLAAKRQVGRATSALMEFATTLA